MPNVLANPRNWKTKAILAKLETATGTDAAPTGALNWIEARNVTFTPYDAETVDRNIEMPYLGNGGKLPTGKYASLTFEAAVVGAGAAGASPGISPLLLACGFAETVDDTQGEESVTYNLVSAGFSSITLYVNIDGALHKMIGARGNVTLTLTAQGIPLYKFDMQAVYLGPAAGAVPAVDKSGWQIEQPVGSLTTAGVTIAGTALAWSEFTLDLGNQISRLDLPGPQREITISDRKPTGAITVLAPALDAFDPFALADAGTLIDLSTTQDNRAGYKARIDSKIQIIRPEYAQIEGNVAYRLNFEPMPVAGNDELAITYI
ncbi:MAG: hypothetical protein LBE85_04335 [Candidatus Accumulibacter sp.]|jgi:hypothetical protein|nr:hypothetical protein [Accumulibacter sp.]